MQRIYFNAEAYVVRYNLTIVQHFNTYNRMNAYENLGFNVASKYVEIYFRNIYLVVVDVVFVE